MLDGGAGADLLDGGAGIDRVDYGSSGAGVVIDLADGPASGGEAAGDRLVGIEAVDGSRSEEHTSELQSLMRISYAVFCLKKKKTTITHTSQIKIKTTKKYDTLQQK